MAGTAKGTNVDGRPTGGTNPLIDSLVWGGAWSDEEDGPVTVSYMFQSGRDPYAYFSDRPGYRWFDHEKDAVRDAFAAWEAVADIRFEEVDDPERADIWYWIGDGSQMGSTLGWHEVPGEAVEPLYGAFNWQGFGWDDRGLKPGGYGFITVLHEIGHGLGLAHPHDGGYAEDATTFPGVSAPFADYGRHDLNQGIWTTMTYNDGWATKFPEAWSETHGWQATPMALDIAAAQEIYGANMDHATGRDVYTLPADNKRGTGYTCIWDAGGIDKISHRGGEEAAIIDLDDAPLTGRHAGGYVSYVKGVIGGVTIANGVVIENAIGGRAGDRIRGNEAHNMLDGRGGDDHISGSRGDDRMFGGGGDDRLRGGRDDDIVAGGRGDDEVWGQSGHDRMSGMSGADVLRGGKGDDKAQGGSGDDTVRGNGGDDVVRGGRGDDRVYGGQGADDIWGGGGADKLYGGHDDARDTFLFRGKKQSEADAPDRIYRFESGTDVIDLSRIDADPSLGGNQALDWSGKGPAAASVWLEDHGRHVRVFADVNGDGEADFALRVFGVGRMDEGDFIL
ncbi:Possible Zn-dependent metalloprotease [Oceanicola granulosus HTCC2516]|uniref:Possible Zn-dependent metalloprotease n=1 Tax=Oceanicola granulosus (strain ATCC BAA-861 / DSM 15982 / KCTC 12143 / HTCC2516) TaxID=314256 RepID=Q2CJH6_OCEGH|nr:M10 family metallopeptidase C-terminal domain-containing protein [Oceanicola granulosus]EAR53163.1 Possible Zn-dependent metalloprotease [Oceanicola granulosus HTCC2516]